MNGVFGKDSALVRLYWAGDNLGENYYRYLLCYVYQKKNIYQYTEYFWYIISNKQSIYSVCVDACPTIVTPSGSELWGALCLLSNGERVVQQEECIMLQCGVWFHPGIE